VKVIYTDISPKQSSREGARIHGLVLHTTEGGDSPSGDADLKGLGSLFHSEEASAHLGVNVVGRFGRYVADDNKAWAVCNFNSVTLSLEQIGFAAFSKEQWFKRPEQLKGAAEFLAYGHINYGIPLEPGEVSGSAITKAGIFQHKDLGISGSGHSDCGEGYPQGYVTLLAKFYIAHKLHPRSVHCKDLEKQINGIRRQHNIPLIGA
jgi:hypothetical protein